MKIIKICIVCSMGLLFSNSEATKPSIPSLKMEMSIQHDGNWEVGIENKVTFTFTPLQDVPHEKKYPDEAVIVFDSGLVFVSGDTIWSGFLEKDREYSFSAVLKPIKAGKLVLGAGVRSSLSKIFTDEEIKELERREQEVIDASPVLKERGEIPGIFPRKVYYYRNSCSALINVKGTAAGQPETTWYEIDGMKVGPKRIGRPLDSLIRERENYPRQKKPNGTSSNSVGETKSEPSGPPYLISGTFDI